MRYVRIAGVIVGALILTALGIDAADTLSGTRGTLLSNVVGTSFVDRCPGGMIAVDPAAGFSCVDAYEASPDGACPIVEPKNIFDSQQNLESDGCTSTSKKEAVPWRFVTREQAVQACAKAGKRLPTTGEWYSIAVGIQNVETKCNVSGGELEPSGTRSSCVSPSGAYDMIGNVWEWVSDDVFNGTFNGRTIPSTGYVTQTDGSGVAVVSSSTSNALFGDDYFWSDPDGVFGMMRGGFYGSGSDAGLYAVHAGTLPTAAGAAIGFRCVK